MMVNILNNKMFEYGCYLNLPNEEWSMKIMINLLINHDVDVNMNEEKKESLLQA